MYESYAPSKELAPYVECYWSWQVSPEQEDLDDILPDAAPELIIHLGSPPFVLAESGEWLQQPQAFLYCAAQKALTLSVRAPMKVFAIRFRPWGVSRFSDKSMADMIDRTVLPANSFS